MRCAFERTPRGEKETVVHKGSEDGISLSLSATDARAVCRYGQQQQYGGQQQQYHQQHQQQRELRRVFPHFSFRVPQIFAEDAACDRTRVAGPPQSRGGGAVAGARLASRTEIAPGSLRWTHTKNARSGMMMMTGCVARLQAATCRSCQETGFASRARTTTSRAGASAGAAAKSARRSPKWRVEPRCRVLSRQSGARLYTRPAILSRAQCAPLPSRGGGKERAHVS